MSVRRRDTYDAMTMRAIADMMYYRSNRVFTMCVYIYVNFVITPNIYDVCVVEVFLLRLTDKSAGLHIDVRVKDV